MMKPVQPERTKNVNDKLASVKSFWKKNGATIVCVTAGAIIGTVVAERVVLPRLNDSHCSCDTTSATTD